VTVRTALALLGATAGSIALSACSGTVVQDDLFVQRTGSGPGANLSLVVNDAGTASCNRRPSVPISGSQLIEARYIQMTMQPQASAGLTLGPGPAPVLHYTVHTPDGHVSFYDDSPRQPGIFSQIMLLTLQIAQQACHLKM
jgi:hypothetical protein